MKSSIKEYKIAILGDLILDKYKYFKAIKLSPEGPAPIVKPISSIVIPGGSGNVAMSLSNIGFDVALYYSYSKKQEILLETILNTLKENKIKLKKINSQFENPIPVKVRYYVDNKQFLREDLEQEVKNELVNKIDSFFISNCLEKYDLIVISDYGKGFFNDSSLREFIQQCNENKIPLFIDTKIKTWETLKDSFCIKINQIEFNKLFKDLIILKSDSIEIIRAKVSKARYISKVKNFIVTLGSLGAVISTNDETLFCSANNQEVIDSTGAGDAFLSGLVFSFLKSNLNSKQYINKLELKDLKLANYVSSLVINEKGTVPIREEIITKYLNSDKRKIVGFTNGCFDILHSGHTSLLKQAKEKCDYLIVGLNSDSSIKKIKGSERPILDQETRFNLISSIKYVDEVRIFNEVNPEKLIMEIKPDILIKGQDYKEEEIIGSDFVKSYGGKVFRAKFLKNKSSSNIIKKIKTITK